jgi:outer membrane PBP1 activator LpoA protein
VEETIMKAPIFRRSRLNRRGHLPALVAAIGAAILLNACASAPEPTAQLQAAQQAISDAERAEANRHAANDLSDARNKLTAANAAVETKDMEQAARLADQARVDAELASARTAAVKAQAVNEEMRRGSEALQQEIQRNTGDSQ